ncbi:MAG TPA: hypothetical protein VK175_13520 [Leadbetterella sp.]|nr:hypothetical protein [Leadbetterella sp.]
MTNKKLNNLCKIFGSISSKEVVNQNRVKLDSGINRWREYPNNSKERRIYDEHTLDFSTYLEKHYSLNVYSTWSRWKKWYTFIDAAFDENRHLEFKLKKGYYRVDYNFTEYIECLKDTKGLENIPNDIKKVIVFLKMDGFYEHYKINISDWLFMKNFCNPENEIKNAKYSIIELLEIRNADNFLREQLLNLKWWDITRGDPQGY